jgi:hypothetical protein
VTPQPAPPSLSTGSLPYAGAPAVDTPLNASGIDADPCKVASAAEVENLAGASVKRAEAENVGSQDRQCSWTLNNGFGVLSGGVVRSGSGLSALYDKRAKGQLSVFQAVSAIQGYPAIVASNRPSSNGFCTVVVGISNESTYTAPVSLDSSNPGYNDPCSTATKLATVAVKNLKGA